MPSHDDIDYIEDELANTDADIMVLDPMTGFVSQGIRTGDDASIRRMLTPLAQLAEMYECCIILIRHLKKDSTEKNPIYRGGGSIGITGQARVGLLVGTRSPLGRLAQTAYCPLTPSWTRGGSPVRNLGFSAKKTHKFAGYFQEQGAQQHREPYPNV